MTDPDPLMLELKSFFTTLLTGACFGARLDDEVADGVLDLEEDLDLSVLFGIDDDKGTDVPVMFRRNPFKPFA